MRCLLDTHAFIWVDNEPAKLPLKVVEAVQNPKNEIFISIANLWGMQIKLQGGKLSLRTPLRNIVDYQRNKNHIQLLSINLAHVLALESLPSHHKDPFDRILIAQAQIENLTLISHDSTLTQYPVQVVW